jgi:hypothetical protein
MAIQIGGAVGIEHRGALCDGDDHLFRRQQFMRDDRVQDVLAGMIAAKAAGLSYRDLVQQKVIGTTGLDSTFYEIGSYLAAVINRLAHGSFDNPDCANYQLNSRSRKTARAADKRISLHSVAAH